jgi:hypothetical protein
MYVTVSTGFAASCFGAESVQVSTVAEGASYFVTLAPGAARDGGAGCEHAVELLLSSKAPTRTRFRAQWMPASAPGRRSLLGAAAAKTLIPGVPQPGAVPRQGTMLYGINITAPITLFEVTLTSTSGDPDLYLTLDGSEPSADHWDYASSSVWGDDQVSVRANDTAVRSKCPSPSPARPCTILIAVYGWRASNFTVVAASQSESVSLLDGEPFVDAAAQWEYRYYVFRPSSAAPVSIQLTSFSGDADLLVGSSALPGQRRPSMANSSSFCDFSLSTRRDVVDIDEDSDCFCDPSAASPSAPCEYYIAVTAWAEATAFSVLARQGAAAIALLDGVPQAGFVDDGEQEQYSFAFSLPAAGALGRRRLSISLATYVGDADVFVTLDGKQPGPAHFQYVSASPTGADEVVVRPTDDAYLRFCGGLDVCTVRIGVYGYGASIYVLTASALRHTRLEDGQQLQDSVDKGSYVFYTYAATDSSKVTFSVSPLGGDPDLYVGCDSNANTTAPTSAAGTWLWRSIGLGTEVVVVESEDKRRCTAPCNYYLGVTAFRNNASFVVSAKSDSAAPTELVLGEPVLDSVEEGAYARYRVSWVPASGPLTLSLTPLYGDPDLFVRLDNKTVTFLNPQYTSTSAGNGVESITIPLTANDPVFGASVCAVDKSRPCTVFVAVYGFYEARYTISASSGITRLADGNAVTGQVSANTSAYFYFDAISILPFTITMTPLSGDPDM